jgi:23S rRNA (adenine2503-C2)-methyltransferase
MSCIFSHTAASYASYVMTQLSGKGGLHAIRIYKKWMRQASLYEEESNAKTLISSIYSITSFTIPTIVFFFEKDGTKKILLKAIDGNIFEMVLLPMLAGWTLCISSQIGCKIGCSFCETAKMGFLRSLTVEEIVSQLFIAKHHFKVDVRNIVFMGMGEPFDNYENVMQAVLIFTDMNGFAIGPKHITISTSGLIDKIYRFKKEAHPALNLAISINAPTHTKREKLMVITKTHSMKDLKEAMISYLEHPRRQIFIEYVLIQNRNDSLEDADHLAIYLEGLRVKVNLIPYNSQRRGNFAAPSGEVVKRFSERLREKGLNVFIRDTKGEQIRAACGQLNSKNSLVFSN